MSHSVQDFMSKSDPYLQFSRQMPDGRLQVVHRTEVRIILISLLHNYLHFQRHTWSTRLASVCPKVYKNVDVVGILLL